MQGLGSWNQFLKISNYLKTCSTSFSGAPSASLQPEFPWRGVVVLRTGLSPRKVTSLSRVRLCDSMRCGLSGSSIHGIFQARVLGWAAISRRQEPLANALGDCSFVADTREMDGQLDLLTKNNGIVIFTSKAGLFRSSKGLKF